jgi:8-oxo-dGTP pyrophosphatase MutT (NUDIX family)
MGIAIPYDRKPYQLVASVFVVHEGKVLLVKHRKLGIWLPPGGHVEHDGMGNFIETPEEAAVREVKEETGLDIDIVGDRKPSVSSRRIPHTIPADMHIHPIDESHDHLGLDFLGMIREGSDESPGLVGDEHAEWFDEKRLDEMVGTEGFLDDVRLRALGAIRAFAGTN